MQWLWTDVLMQLLVLAIAVLLALAIKQPALQRPLQTLLASRVAMGSASVLLSFTLIAWLDSLHFVDHSSRSKELVSVLDVACTAMRSHTEKTYSPPFAAFGYNKEQVIGADGRAEWTYARLQYGGAHLLHPDDELFGDISSRLAVALAESGAAVGVLALLLRRYCRGLWRLPSLRTAFTVMALLSVLAYSAWQLSAYYHVFGTDKVGEDVLYQVLKSIRTGLVIGCLTTLIMLPLAIALGILAGFFKGWVDDAIQFIYTTLNSIPSVLLIAASILMAQVYMATHAEQFASVVVRADMRLLFLCLVLGMTSWTGLCRLLRAETLKLREMEYVLAAQALGVSRLAVLWRHILPNVMHIVVIAVVLDFSSLVLAEAVLSYINIGVDPSTYSWGNMINGARLEMAREPVVWWSLAAAFVMMLGLVLAANLFADCVRDAFDPRRNAHG